MKMMHTNLGDLPPLAIAFANHIKRKFGWCGEVALTCWAVYAQEIDGLSCDDELYQSRPEDKQWFNENKDKNWQWVGSKVVVVNNE